MGIIILGYLTLFAVSYIPHCVSIQEAFNIVERILIYHENWILSTKVRRWCHWPMAVCMQVILLTVMCNCTFLYSHQMMCAVDIGYVAGLHWFPYDSLIMLGYYRMSLCLTPTSIKSLAVSHFDTVNYHNVLYWSLSNTKLSAATRKLSRVLLITHLCYYCYYTWKYEFYEVMGPLETKFYASFATLSTAKPVLSHPAHLSREFFTVSLLSEVLAPATFVCCFVLFSFQSYILTVHSLCHRSQLFFPSQPTVTVSAAYLKPWNAINGRISSGAAERLCNGFP